eukprot:2858303-Pyramimonas_sp.AAC.2
MRQRSRRGHRANAKTWENGCASRRLFGATYLGTEGAGSALTSERAGISQKIKRGTLRIQRRRRWQRIGNILLEFKGAGTSR